MYNREAYIKIKEEYELKHNEAMNAATARKNELYLISPELEAIDKELAKTGLRIFRAAVKHENVKEEMDAIKATNENLRDDKKKLLKLLGYPEDYTDVKYECPLCSDTGYVNSKMCACMKKKIIKESVKMCGLSALIEKETFDNFDTSFYGERESLMKKTLAFFKRYAESFGENSESLLLIGDTGLGKTHILSSIAKVVIENGSDVFYVSAPQINSDFEYEQFKGGQSGEKTARYFDCELLIIDDLGAELATQFTVSCLYNILNTRINSGKATLISTNMDGKAIEEKYDARISSRLLSYRQIPFIGTDIRLQKKLR